MFVVITRVGGERIVHRDGLHVVAARHDAAVPKGDGDGNHSSRHSLDADRFRGEPFRSNHLDIRCSERVPHRSRIASAGIA